MHFRAEKNKTRRRWRGLRLLNWSGLATAIGLAAVTDWSVLSLVAPFRARCKDEGIRLEAALNGEQRLLATLNTLPAQTEVYRNLSVEEHGRKYVFDYLVVGPASAWILETRYLKGRIESEPLSDCWRQYRDPFDRRAGRMFRNPMGKLEDAVQALRRHLARSNVHLPIYGVVVQTHPHGRLSEVTRHGPVRSLHLHELVDHLTADDRPYPSVCAMLLSDMLKRYTPRNRVARTVSPKPVAFYANNVVARLAGKRNDSRKF